VTLPGVVKEFEQVRATQVTADGRNFCVDEVLWVWDRDIGGSDQVVRALDCSRWMGSPGVVVAKRWSACRDARGDDVLGCIAEYIAATDPPVVACGNPEPMAMGKPVRVPVRDPGEKFDSSVV
jgi:hypothetical protein